MTDLLKKEWRKRCDPFTVLTRYWQDERGATAIEFALVAAMVVVAFAGIMSAGGAIEVSHNELLHR